MADGGFDPQWGWGLMRHQPSGVGVECGYSDSQSPLHCLHCLPQRPPSFPGRLQHTCHLPSGQTASAVNVHDVGGLVHNLSGPAQGV